MKYLVRKRLIEVQNDSEIFINKEFLE